MAKTESEWWNNLYDIFLEATDHRIRNNTTGSWVAWRQELDGYIKQLKKFRELNEICREFIEKQEISCPETIYQTDRVILNAYEFIENVCNQVGYHKPENYEDIRHWKCGKPHSECQCASINHP